MDSHSSKFWSIELVGIGYKIEYGALGSNPGTSEKKFKDEQTAEKKFEKQIKERLFYFSG
jgi:predicted DNA-binding WGR domain protein